MEHLDFQQQDNGLSVTNIPDAIKLVRIENNPIARQIADCWLHTKDLRFVIEVLGAINSSASQTVKEALWQIAIVKFIKCFVGGSARIQLDEKVVFRGNDIALKVFRYFKDLRDKHFIHDENSYAQAIVAAALNDGSKSFSVEKIVAVSVIGATLNQENFDNLTLSANHSLKWVGEKFDSLCNDLTIELEKSSYKVLKELPEPTIKVPELKDIGSRREIAPLKARTPDRPPSIEKAYWVSITDGTRSKWTNINAVTSADARSRASSLLAGTRWRVS